VEITDSPTISVLTACGDGIHLYT